MDTQKIEEFILNRPPSAHITITPDDSPVPPLQFEHEVHAVQEAIQEQNKGIPLKNVDFVAATEPNEIRRILDDRGIDHTILDDDALDTIATDVRAQMIDRSIEDGIRALQSIGSMKVDSLLADIRKEARGSGIPHVLASDLPPDPYPTTIHRLTKRPVAEDPPETIENDSMLWEISMYLAPRIAKTLGVEW